MAKQIITPEYRIHYPVKVAKSKIAGKGAYAMQNMKEAKELIKNLKVINCVELDNNLALNASANPNDIRFINHSCGPNTYMRVMKDRVEFYALKNIKKGEELSCDYGETHHEGTLPCKCGAKNCRGFI
jgi:uncharacterized protein